MTTTGVGVDATGGPVVDPTKNVLDLVEAANRRQDDLRRAEAGHLRELMQRDREHEAELRRAEKDRLDAIRAVDVNAVQRAAEVANQQATTLAAGQAAQADAVRVTLAAALEPIQKDIAELRKSQYELAGQRAQVGESRLNVGALLGGLSVLLVLVFGIVSLWLGTKP